MECSSWKWCDCTQPGDLQGSGWCPLHPPSDLEYPPPPLCPLPYTDPLPDLQHSTYCTYFVNTLSSPLRCTKPPKSKADRIQKKKNVHRTLCWLCSTHTVHSERDCKHTRHSAKRCKSGQVKTVRHTKSGTPLCSQHNVRYTSLQSTRRGVHHLVFSRATTVQTMLPSTLQRASTVRFR